MEEETGLRCELGDELPWSRYRDKSGRPKVVRYWAMRPLGGDFHPHDEVDDVRWLPLDAAGGAAELSPAIARCCKPSRTALV